MKALIIGATGATGRELVKALVTDELFTEIHLFGRSESKFKDLKIINHIVDFNQPENWSDLITGDVVFSCLGTTLKAAGSTEAQRKVDFDYQYNFAKHAKKNGVEDYILVSSYGADPNSRMFYSKMKGELDVAVKQLNFEKTTIFQPGMLDRPETERSTEVIGLKLLKFINKIGLLKSQKPLPTSVLAKAMINAAKIKSKGFSVIKLSNIFSFAEKKS